MPLPLHKKDLFPLTRVKIGVTLLLCLATSEFWGQISNIDLWDDLGTILQSIRLKTKHPHLEEGRSFSRINEKSEANPPWLEAARPNDRSKSNHEFKKTKTFNFGNFGENFLPVLPGFWEVERPDFESQFSKHSCHFSPGGSPYWTVIWTLW